MWSGLRLGGTPNAIFVTGKDIAIIVRMKGKADRLFHVFKVLDES